MPNHIFITGTSAGVGGGLAAWYLENGNRVTGLSRNPNPALDNYREYSFCQADLAKLDKIESQLSHFLGDANRLDLVILNAGILPEIKDMADTSLGEIRKIMDVNVWANKVLIDVLFKHVPDIRQVVAISSGAAVSGARGWNAYSLSKATLNMLVNLYAKEREGTHFSALAPGLIDTGMQDYLYQVKNEEKFPVLQKLKAAKGTEKMPDPRKAAPAIADAIEKSLNHPSGSFLDIRDMS